MSETNVQTTPEVSPLESLELEDYRSFRTSGQLPNESGAAADEADAKPDAATEPAETVQADESGDDEELPRGVKTKVQREIDKAVRLRKEAEELLAQAKKQAGNGNPDTQTGKPDAASEATKTENSKPKPKLDDFVVKGIADGTYPDYDTAHEAFTEQLTDWKLEQRFAADKAQAEKTAAENAAKTAWEEKLAPVKAKYADYDAVLAGEPVAASDALVFTLARHPQGPELVYHLIKNPSEVEALNKLTDPVSVAIALEGLKPKFIAPANNATPPRMSSAPAPISPVSGSRPVVTKSLDEIDDLDEYRATRERRRR